MRKLALTVCALAGLTLSVATQAQTYNYTLAGASPGGLWSNIGVGMDQVMKAAHPGSTVTYQTTGGGIANAQLLEQKKVQPAKDLRPLAYLYNWSPFQLLLTKDFADRHGIKTFEDIVTKKAPVRVVLNRRGNIAYDLAVRMFAAAGASLDDIKAWGGNVVLAGSEEQGDLLKDRRVDFLFNSLFIGQRSLVEVGQALPVVMLPVSKAVIDKVAKETGADPYVIKANSYAWQPQDVPTISLGAFVVANAAMSDAEAKAIT
jgi:TRAP-type uncharacterized transport system substrate-binding protein